MRIRNCFRRGGDPNRHSLVGGIKNNPRLRSCGYVETLLTMRTSRLAGWSDARVTDLASEARPFAARGHVSHITNAAAIIAQPSTASPIAAHKAGT